MPAVAWIPHARERFEQRVGKYQSYLALEVGEKIDKKDYDVYAAHTDRLIIGVKLDWIGLVMFVYEPKTRRIITVLPRKETYLYEGRSAIVSMNHHEARRQKRRKLLAHTMHRKLQEVVD